MDIIIVDLMINFLRNSFPVVKFKSGRRFKRGVNLDGSQYFLPSQSVVVYSKTYDMLKSYYDANDDEINSVITKFYKIK